jgi:hypothetical protein
MSAGMCGVPSQAVAVLSALGVVGRDSDEASEAGHALDWDSFVRMVKDFTLWPKLRALVIDGNLCRIDVALLYGAIDACTGLLAKSGALLKMQLCPGPVAGPGKSSVAALHGATWPILLALVVAAVDKTFGSSQYKANPTGTEVVKAAITYLTQNRDAIQVRVGFASPCELRPSRFRPGGR